MPVKFNRGKSPPKSQMSMAIDAHNKQLTKRSGVKVGKVRSREFKGKGQTGSQAVGPKWLDKKKQSRSGSVADMLKY